MTGKERQSNVRAWLADWNGSEQSRCCLTEEEAKALALRHDAAKLVTADLDILAYASRFAESVTEAIAGGLKANTWSFWILVRTHFLELGGGYKPGRVPPQSVCHKKLA